MFARRSCTVIDLKYTIKANLSPNGNGFAFNLFGDPSGNRTHDYAVRGRRLSRLTMGPIMWLAVYYQTNISSTIRRYVDCRLTVYCVTYILYHKHLKKSRGFLKIIGIFLKFFKKAIRRVLAVVNVYGNLNLFPNNDIPECFRKLFVSLRKTYL